MVENELTVILLCGGTGKRLGTSLPKQFLPLKNKPVFAYSLDVFLSMPEVGEVVVAVAPQYRELFPNDPRIVFAKPGKERQDSVQNSLLASKKSLPFIAVHDAARPFITVELVRKVLAAAISAEAAAPALAVPLTIKQANTNGTVIKTLPRHDLFAIQTPQIVKRERLLEGFEKAKGQLVTDDLSLVELLGISPLLVKGEEKNLKITTSLDLALAELLVSHE